MQLAADWIIAAAFVFLVLFAMICDIRSLRIPNWVSLALAVLFLAFALVQHVTADTAPYWPLTNLAVALAVLGITFIFFALGWLGGGDAKFLSALALWAGTPLIADFALLVALLGGAMALGLVALRQMIMLAPRLAAWPILTLPARWAEEKIFPYGVPIGIAALILAPRFLAMG